MINYWSWWWEDERDELARTILTISVPVIALLFMHNGRNRLPPGPYGLPVFGYLPFLSHNLHERFTEMAHRYGPIFSLNIGSKFHVVVNSMDLAKVVARDLDQTFANRSPTGRNREMQKQKEHFHRILDSIIEERIETNSTKMEGAVEEEGRKDFLQIMLELKDQKDASTSFDIVHIKALLFIKVSGCSSQFRVHPPLPLLVQRSPDESCTVGGYMVPNGSIVYINVWAIQRDPRNWTDPLEFRPERFLSGKWDYTGNNLKFLPFGSGRRMCPGVPLGEKMLMYILASLLHSFDWILPKDEEFELSDEFGFVTKKRKPLVAIPSQRLSDATLYK
ncbi:hypothetical protein L1987_02978 [Smallanthus sonchifolius]|uniref:Uncharacterized protein n=1 Tax=Smallanthus sonchifolius TaxID=185202 RepID=A0ACB9K9G2_9ASTR|nr:hypothetical protein L1987_02978 [Smallanthus sonchifolius]